MVLYSDSSSSRQLIARKGLGKARHLDVDLLWIQRIDDLKIKPIKGKDNPADLGTKPLTRDKIRKYMLTIGYIGDYLDEGEAVDTGEANVRMAQGRTRVDEGKTQRIIQAVTMAVLIGLGETHEEKDERRAQDEQRAGPSMCVIAMAEYCSCTYAEPCLPQLFCSRAGLKERLGRRREKEKKRKEKKKNEW